MLGENGYTILLAEDDPVSKKLLLKYLGNNGFRIVVASNGIEAVSAYKSQVFNLVLMDVRMPDLDGYESTSMIREYEKTTGQHVPIIAVTACAIQGDREKCLAAGMDEYVTKPVNLEELLQIIYKWLNQDTSRSSE